MHFSPKDRARDSHPPQFGVAFRFPSFAMNPRKPLSFLSLFFLFFVSFLLLSFSFIFSLFFLPMPCRQRLIPLASKNKLERRCQHLQTRLKQLHERAQVRELTNNALLSFLPFSLLEFMLCYVSLSVFSHFDLLLFFLFLVSLLFLLLQLRQSLHEHEAPGIEAVLQAGVDHERLIKQQQQAQQQAQQKSAHQKAKPRAADYELDHHEEEEKMHHEEQLKHAADEHGQQDKVER